MLRFKRLTSTEGNAMVGWVAETWSLDPVGMVIYAVGAVTVIAYTCLYWGRILYLWLRGED